MQVPRSQCKFWAALIGLYIIMIVPEVMAQSGRPSGTAPAAGIEKKKHRLDHQGGSQFCAAAQCSIEFQLRLPGLVHRRRHGQNILCRWYHRQNPLERGQLDLVFIGPGAFSKILIRMLYPAMTAVVKIKYRWSMHKLNILDFRFRINSCSIFKIKFLKSKSAIPILKC